MKRLWPLLVLIILAGKTSFAQDSGVGLGIIIGEPTGISLKNWLSRSTAFDAAVAWSFEGDDNLHLHLDYLFHNFSVFNPRNGQLPLYYGIGGRLKFNHKTRFGVRGVIGIDYLFSNAPFDIFLEVVPILDLAPSTDFSFNAALGFRYFF
jgi:hypothetical protein